MTRVCGPVCPCDMYFLGCELINTQHGLTNAQFKEYQEENVSVMVWTVDSPSRFSQLWCLGVDYVKTNELHILSAIEKPSWFLTRRNYYIGWSQLNLSIVIVSVITYFLLKRRKTF